MRFAPLRVSLVKSLMLLPCSLFALPIHAQYEDLEWDPQQGYHQEEWYDPSDWFNDDDQISYEYDMYDVYQPYEYDRVGEFGYNVYVDEWDYGYGYDYSDDTWGTDYHYSAYADDYDYGWHYDEFTDTWEYGYHFDEFEYYTDEWYR